MKTRDEIVRQIEEAFAGVELGDGISMSETEVLDEYGSPDERRIARQRDETKDWILISNKDLEAHQVVFSFSDAKTRHFYIPAYMRYTLLNWSTSHSIVIDYTIYALEDSDDERWSLLNGDQKQAVLAFLEYMSSGDWKCDQGAAICALADWKEKAQPAAGFDSPGSGEGSRNDRSGGSASGEGSGRR